jgi:hypothetical protein
MWAQDSIKNKFDLPSESSIQHSIKSHLFCFLVTAPVNNNTTTPSPSLSSSASTATAPGGGRLSSPPAAPHLYPMSADELDFYRQYDPMEGVTTAVVLGGFFVFVCLLVVYKTKLKPLWKERRRRLHNTPATRSAADMASSFSHLHKATKFLEKNILYTIECVKNAQCGREFKRLNYSCLKQLFLTYFLSSYRLPF